MDGLSGGTSSNSRPASGCRKNTAARGMSRGFFGVVLGTPRAFSSHGPLVHEPCEGPGNHVDVVFPVPCRPISTVVSRPWEHGSPTDDNSTTVSHSIYKCTLFLACLLRHHQRQKQSRHATRHVLFLITDGDRVYPDIKNQIYFGDVKNEETESHPSGNPATLLQDPTLPEKPPSSPLTPVILLSPRAQMMKQPKQKQSTVVTSGVFVQMPVRSGQGSLNMDRAFSGIETDISKEGWPPLVPDTFLLANFLFSQ